MSPKRPPGPSVDPDTPGSTEIPPAGLIHPALAGSQHRFPMAWKELLPKNLWGALGEPQRSRGPGGSRRHGGNREIGTGSRQETLIGYFWTTGS